MEETRYLTGQFLLAMPGIGDPRFEHSVIAMCSHDEDGALGIGVGAIINGLGLHDVLEQLEIAPGVAPDAPVHFGGPVEARRGFVLHSTDWGGQDTLSVAGRWALSSTLDVLRAIAGGTGPARRDVTPEATKAVGTKEMPGFGEQMRQISLHFVPTAILSRQTAVIRESGDHAALVMNLPGQPKSIKETLEGLKDADGKTLVGGIFAAVPYCIDLIGGPYIETHPDVCKAFRPKSALRPATQA